MRDSWHLITEYRNTSLIKEMKEVISRVGFCSKVKLNED